MLFDAWTFIAECPWLSLRAAQGARSDARLSSQRLLLAEVCYISHTTSIRPIHTTDSVTDTQRGGTERGGEGMGGRE